MEKIRVKLSDLIDYLTEDYAESDDKYFQIGNYFFTKEEFALAMIDYLIENDSIKQRKNSGKGKSK